MNACVLASAVPGDARLVCLLVYTLRYADMLAVVSPGGTRARTRYLHVQPLPRGSDTRFTP